MAESENAAKGREVQRQLWGDRVADADHTAAPFAEVAPDFFPLVREFCFGMFWSRPGLPVRDRSLITVAMLAALGKQEELRGHLAGARSVGLSNEELIEALMQVAVYAGVPAAVNALNTAASVLTPEE
jgi:alkylhydroperoxidase/carboxymuconolactone decarboxylase family protein YurZ